LTSAIKLSWAIIALFLGVIIYLFPVNGVLRNILPDFLWAVSFSVSLNLFASKFSPLLHVLTITLLGSVYEIGQKLSFWHGTYDVLDILAYITGAIFGQLICLKGFSNRKFWISINK